jgi:hypothetical protein
VALKADFAAPAHASDIERRVRAAGRQWTGAIVQRLVEPGGTDVLVGPSPIPISARC